MLPVVHSPREIARALSRKVPKYITLDESRALLSDRLKDENYVSWFLCLMLLRTGARVSELLAVRLGDVDYNNQTIRIVTEKRQSHERFVPVQADILAAVGEWITIQAQSGRTIARKDRLFNFGRIMAFLRVRDAFQLAGIEKVDDKGKSNAHPHSLRHTYSIINLAQGVPIITVSEWLLSYPPKVGPLSMRKIDPFKWLQTLRRLRIQPAFCMLVRYAV
ncbi:MAG: site-specific integrase [Sporomusaceae bacterium]|nr:site-specific integrase [Sporomusaceae bacterium]